MRSGRRSSASGRGRESKAQKPKKEKVPQKIFRLHDTGSNTVMTMPNSGLGNCALLGLIQTKDLKDGIPHDTCIGIHER